MAEERNGTNRLDTGEGQASDEVLTPEICQLLGSLALNVQKHTELADALAEVGRTMDTLVKRHPQFAGPAMELRAKMTQLQRLLGSMGTSVMRYALEYEDSIADAGD